MSRFLVAPRFVAVALAAITLTAVGCSGGGTTAKGTTVKGLVTVKGQPATGVVLNFQGENNQVSSTTTGADGRYVLEGAPSGAVKVSLTSVTGMPGGPTGGMPGMPKGSKPPEGAAAATAAKVVDIPNKYTKPETSGLNYTIEGKEQTIDIVIP